MSFAPPLRHPILFFPPQKTNPQHNLLVFSAIVTSSTYMFMNLHGYIYASSKTLNFLLGFQNLPIIQWMKMHKEIDTKVY
jgi:hypothetical protein